MFRGSQAPSEGSVRRKTLPRHCGLALTSACSLADTAMAADGLSSGWGASTGGGTVTPCSWPLASTAASWHGPCSKIGRGGRRSSSSYGLRSSSSGSSSGSISGAAARQSSCPSLPSTGVFSLRPLCGVAFPLGSPTSAEPRQQSAEWQAPALVLLAQQQQVSRVKALRQERREREAQAEQRYEALWQEWEEQEARSEQRRQQQVALPAQDMQQRQHQRDQQQQQGRGLHDLFQDPATLFAAGELLGAGGQGVVRRVVVGSEAYALKRERGAPCEVELFECKRLGSKWVPTALAWKQCGEWGYSLYPLAAGSLLDALIGWQLQQQAHAEGVAAFAPLPFAAARLLMAQMAAAVRVMHGNGLRHGDIKPANFMIDLADGCLVLGDLGAADSARVHALEAGGTPGFMAPEQLPIAMPQGGAPGPLAAIKALARVWAANRAERLGRADSRPVDVWALGVTWAHLLLPAADAEAAVAARRKGCSRGRQRGQHWPPPAEAVPAPLADLLGRMLTASPKQRATIEEVIGDEFFGGLDWAAVEGRLPAAVPAGLDLAALAAAGRPAVCAAVQKVQGCAAYDEAALADDPQQQQQQQRPQAAEEKPPQQRQRGRWARRLGSLAVRAVQKGAQAYAAQLAFKVAMRALRK